MSDDALRAEIVALRNHLADLERRLDEPDTSPEPERTPQRFSRRGLLAAAVAGGAGLVAAQVTTAAPAAAAPGGNLVLGATNDAGAVVTSLKATTGQNASPFLVVNPDPNEDSIGINGRLGARTGRFDGIGYQRAAVVGESARSTGVTGLSNEAPGVLGSSDWASGIHGVSNHGAGVSGESPTIAVSGQSTGSYGVYGSSPTAFGVVGASESGGGVRGTTGFGTGVEASSTNGTGVSATSKYGYGVYAVGGLAPLRLKPSPKTGPPTQGNHLPGEFWVDAGPVLWFCTKSGMPGTWKKVTLS